MLLSLLKRLQKIRLEGDTSMGQSFNLFGVLLSYGKVNCFLALIELVSGQELTLAVEADLDQLSCQLLVL